MARGCTTQKGKEVIALSNTGMYVHHAVCHGKYSLAKQHHVTKFNVSFISMLHAPCCSRYRNAFFSPFFCLHPPTFLRNVRCIAIHFAHFWNDVCVCICIFMLQFATDEFIYIKAFKLKAFNAHTDVVHA